jgi:shikimate dehydrogenase
VQAPHIKAGLFGRPLSNSLSPEIFRIFSALCGVKVSYELRDVPREELRHALEAASAEGWSGCNVTIPYKREACALLDLADPAVKACGAVNAIRFGRAGLEGMNTDARALLNALEEAGFSAAGRAAAVFGSGGSAASSGWALGRSQAAAVTFHARNTAEAGKLASKLSDAFPKTVFKTAPFAAPAPETAIFVNATPLGMYAPGRPPCAPGPGSLCADLAYAKGGTEWCNAAASAGAAVIDGLSLLVWQAALSFKFWAGLPSGDIVKFKREAMAALTAGPKGEK